MGTLPGRETPCRAPLDDRQQQGAPWQARRRSRRSGATLIEVLCGVTILVFGFGAGLLSLVSSMNLARAAREQSQALQGAENVMEDLMSANFREVFARYNATAADDPDPMTGPSPGDTFAVAGLTPRPGDPAVGRVLFPGNNVQLFENVVDAALGMPRDLNLRDGVDALDHVGDYRLLPVLVRVRWQGSKGPREVTLAMTLIDRAKVVAE